MNNPNDLNPSEPSIRSDIDDVIKIVMVLMIFAGLCAIAYFSRDGASKAVVHEKALTWEPHGNLMWSDDLFVSEIVRDGTNYFIYYNEATNVVFYSNTLYNLNSPVTDSDSRKTKSAQ